MFLFMFASGFLFGHSQFKIVSMSDYWIYIRKKFKRLMIPYLTISIILLIIKYIAGSIVSLKFPINENFWKFIIFGPDHGFATFLWFIYVLFIIFMLFPIIEYIIKSPIILMLFLLIINYVPLPIPPYFFFNIKLVIFYLPFFYFGYIYSKINNLKKEYRVFAHLLPLYITLYTVLLYWKQEIILNLNQYMRHELSITICDQVIGIFCILSFYYLSTLIANMKKGLLFRVFFYIGEYSMSIYLLHTVSMGIVTVLLIQYLKVTHNMLLLTAILVILSGIILPVIISKYIISRYEILSHLILGVRSAPNVSFIQK